jgi:hypothetical protein
MAIEKRTTQEYYVTSALQYHVSGRFAAFAGFSHVCGILLHHALEMYLKAQLCLKLDEKELKKLGHSLLNAWELFKKEVSAPELTVFDETISTLDEHETLRYPERIAPAAAMTLIIDFSRNKAAGFSNNTTLNQGKQFQVFIDDIDALAKVILEKSKLNSLYFTGGLKNDAQIFLKRENRSVIWGEGESLF